VTLTRKTTTDNLIYGTVNTIENYNYNDLGQLIETKSTTSTGDSLKVITLYPYEKKDSLLVARQMIFNNNFSQPMEQQEFHNGSRVSVTRITYDSLGLMQNGASDLFVPEKVDQSKDGNVFRQLNYITYNDANGDLEQESPSTGSPTSYIWGYGGTLPVAKIINSNFNSGSNYYVAYTSFETVDGNTSGNFTISPAGINTNAAHTGKSQYQVSANATVNCSLVSTCTYYFSFWTSSGSAPTVTITGGSKTLIINGGLVNLGWKLYKYKISGSTNVKIEGSGTIDEVRLYPVDGLMTTYSYEPIYGITSITDPNDVTSYYTYDNFGRLKYIQDFEGNVLQRNEYNLKVK
jgi:YD repeat-containing protein